MSSPANDPAFTSWPRSPKRLHQIDPGLALADMFDPAIARRLWDSLPEECRSDHFDKKTMPAHYRPAIREVSAGSSSGQRLDRLLPEFRGLPEPMTWEVAWIIHRYIELGRFIRIVDANAVFILLRAAIRHGDDECRSAQSLLHRSPDEWVRSARKAQMLGEKIGEFAFKEGTYRLGHMVAVLGYAYHRGPWWELNVWNPSLDPRVPQRDHEPIGSTTMHFTNLTSLWMREGAKYWLSAGPERGEVLVEHDQVAPGCPEMAATLHRHHRRPGPVSDYRSTPTAGLHPRVLRHAPCAPASSPDRAQAALWRRTHAARS